jgi:NAD+ diphosphatase
MASFVPLTFLPDGIDRSSARWMAVRGTKVFLTDAPGFGGDHHFLGLLDGQPVFAEDVGDHHEDDGAFVDLYALFTRVPEVEWMLAGRAVQIVDWARTHRFCGRCATPTIANPNDRSMKCPACGLPAYPRLAPAIITLVTRGDEALLARGVNFRNPTYSALAGFVEAGETLEQAVAREVMEEVAITVGNIRYVSSQPWPFPHSLMLGFEADYVSGDIVCDPSEIVDANWYTRDSLPNIPPGISIARKLIDRWVAGER